jgi:hypothetical protein
MAKMPIWHRRMISGADHPLRQQTRPRACVCLRGKASCRDGHRHFGSDDPRCRQNSSRQQFLGLWSFFGRLHLHSSENTGAPRMADGLRTKERRLK